MAGQCQIHPEQQLGVPQETCRALVRRIAASPEFLRAPRQREFLLYVVDRKLAGCPEEVTEALIGHRVYGRPASYDAGNDSIVRTEARTLRKRLERYFEGPGGGEEIVVEIPRGGYLPVFRARLETVEAAIPAPAPPVAAQRVLLPSRRQALWLGASALAGASGVLAWRGRTRGGARDSGFSGRIGQVQLEASDAALTRAFAQVKQRALACVYSGDPVGEWYATRPDGGSNVFGMRNVAHQSLGAAVLGLHRHTLNMLRCFARSVSRRRDWCGFWVITKDGFAAPSSYTSDADFGYCLPANFDLLRTCYREYLWSGDAAYLEQDFVNFYDTTVKEYAQRWDAESDGVMKNRRRPRVHASYFQQKPDFLTGADLIAAQYAGYTAYAAMQESAGREGSLSMRLAQEYRRKAQGLRKRFNSEWWNAAENRFHSGTLADGEFAAEFVPECILYALLFGIVDEGPHLEAALDTAERNRPQFPGAYSYLPEVLYRYGRHERAYAVLLEIASDDFFGREQGEVAFAAVGAVAGGLMGLSPGATAGRVETLPRLRAGLEWARLSRVPVLHNEIAIEHRGVNESRLSNLAGGPVEWKASFPARADAAPEIVVDGARRPAALERGAAGQVIASVTIPVAEGSSRSAKYPG